MSSRLELRRHPFRLSIGVLLLTSGLIVIAAQGGAHAPDHPLDPYPGFGRSPQAALRDDTIAFWEAFERERLVALCMKEARFDYWPAVAFPAETLPAIARSLGIRPTVLVPILDLSPAERNRAQRTALSPRELDRYYQALVGESARDVAESNRSQGPPAGRGEDFATAGCAGSAAGAVPSVWDLGRQLHDELEALRADIKDSAELAETGEQFERCVQNASGLEATTPEKLEAILAGDSAQAAAVDLAMERCMLTWAEGYRRGEAAAAERFIETHSESLSDVKVRYEAILAKLRADPEFLKYLREESLRAAGDSGGDHHHDSEGH